MQDLPSQLLLQQQKAKPISGTELETFGKHAAVLYSRGAHPTVQEAIIETIKCAALSPEQVCRVVEYANTAAYLAEVNKEAQHRYVELQGGPADPGDVLRELNDGGSPTVIDNSSRDYEEPPPDTKKLSAANSLRLGTYDLLDEAFKTKKAEYVPAEPLRDSVSLRSKLSGMHAHLMSDLTSLEMQLMSDKEELYTQVKEAAQGGLNLGDLLYAWSCVKQPPEMVKHAFSYITPRLVKDKVLEGRVQVAESIETFQKRASVVNEQHPLLLSYSGFCETLTKLAKTRAVVDEVGGHVETLTTFIIQADERLKEASVASEGGQMVGRALLGAGRAAKKGYGALKAGAEEAGQAVTSGLGGARARNAAGELLVDPATGKAISGSLGAEMAGGAVKHAPLAAALGGGALGAEAIDERLSYGQGAAPRAYRGAKEHLTAALRPSSAAGQRRRYQVASGQ